MDERRSTRFGLDAIEVGDAATASAVVVLLHGFAMQPADLSPFAHSMGVPAWFLFPEGPVAAEPGGRAWWHIDAGQRAEALRHGPRDFAGQHPPDLPAARQRLGHFLDALAPAIGGRPLVLGGFSQGGMLTCDTLMRVPRRLAATALLSASRIAADEWQPLLSGAPLRGLPALISHGRTDADLSFAAGEALRDCVTAAGGVVTWVPFDQGHEIPLLVWRRLRKLVLEVTPGRDR